MAVQQLRSGRNTQAAIGTKKKKTLIGGAEPLGFVLPVRVFCRLTVSFVALVLVVLSLVKSSVVLYDDHFSGVSYLVRLCDAAEQGEQQQRHDDCLHFISSIVVMARSRRFHSAVLGMALANFVRRTVSVCLLNSLSRLQRATINCPSEGAMEPPIRCPRTHSQQQ